MIKDDKYYLSKTLDEITTIMNYSKDLSMNDLYDNPIYIDKSEPHTHLFICE